MEHVFDNFHTYLMNILLGDFNAEVVGEDNFKPTIWNESYMKYEVVMIMEYAY
jgi:hypothetical protein